MFPAFDTPKGARRFLRNVGPHADDLLSLRWADQGGKSEYPTDPSMSIDKHQELIDQAREEQAPTGKAALAINGNDLMQAGVKPGPEMGQLLEELVDAVVENPQLNTKEGLLGLLRGQGKIASYDEYEEEPHPYLEMYPQTHPEGHRLNWDGRGFGKGLYNPEDDTLHTWNVPDSDGDPIHSDYAEGVLGHRNYERDNRFHIMPNGYVTAYGQYAGGAPSMHAQRLQSMNPQYKTWAEPGYDPYEGDWDD
jgi:hypothetical protein